MWVLVGLGENSIAASCLGLIEGVPALFSRVGILATKSMLCCFSEPVVCPECVTAVFWLVVQKLRRESAHAHNFQIPSKVRACVDSLDNQPENRCTHPLSSVTRP